MSTTEEFWKAVSEFVPPPPVEHIYRIYYDSSTGEVVAQTHNEMLDIGPCIELTLDEYEQVRYSMPDLIVQDGRLITRPSPRPTPPYRKSEQGIATLKNNMIFVADGSTTDVDYWIRHD